MEEFMEKRKGFLNTVYFLNKMGYVILEIQGMFFIVKQFEEASNGSWKHSLVGKDVSVIVENYAHIHGMDDSKRGEILNKIEVLTETKKFFHKDELFTLHLQ